MITFFRKIRQSLLLEGKTGKYLKYAIGEILLVMIGILLALQVNNWNDSRKSRQIEYALLTELHKSIEEDIKNLNDVIHRNRSYISSAKIVLNTIENKEIVSDSVSYHLQRSFIVWRIYFKTSAYNNLEEYGFNLIKNDNTRKAIISGYDGRAKFVDQLYERYDEFLYNVVEPKLAERFEFKEIGEKNFGLFPVDNDIEADHHRLRYLLIKSIDLQNQIIGAQQRTLRVFDKLYEELKTEIDQKSNHSKQ